MGRDINVGFIDTEMIVDFVGVKEIIRGDNV